MQIYQTTQAVLFGNWWRGETQRSRVLLVGSKNEGARAKWAPDTIDVSSLYCK